MPLLRGQQTCLSGAETDVNYRSCPGLRRLLCHHEPLAGLVPTDVDESRIRQEFALLILRIGLPGLIEAYVGDVDGKSRRQPKL